MDDEEREQEESRLDIPFEQLSPEALLGVIDDFVLREGTDYGDHEPSLQQKRDRVLAQLRAGSAVVVFDASTETCSILLRNGPTT